MASMKIRVRLFWIKLAIKEFLRNGKTDYNLKALIFRKNPINL